MVNGTFTSENRGEIRSQLRADRIELLDRSERAAANAGAADREILRVLASCDRAEIWREEACKSTAEWAARHFNISQWKAARMIKSAHALEKLPYISACLENGSLSLDKVIELTRFATSSTERKLVTWARRVTPKGIRERADQETAVALKKVVQAHSDRYHSSSWDEMNRGLRYEGFLPGDEGVRFDKVIDRLAQQMPDAPTDEEPVTIEQKRADALCALASAHISEDSDPDRATVMMHIDVDKLVTGKGNAELAGSLPIHLDTAKRLCCGSRLQLVVDGKTGPMGAGDVIDGIPHALRRQVLKRDGHRCTWPGCRKKALLVPHHIEHDALGGPTDLFNLTCLCREHHWYVDEGGWGVTRQSNGELMFFTPGGRPYDPGPTPPEPNEVATIHKPPARTLLELRSYSPLFRMLA